MIATATESGADTVLLDLEDAVVPEAKESARENVIWAAREFEWSDQALSVRVNGLDTSWFYRDLISILEAVGETVDTITLPKIRSAADVAVFEEIVSSIETSVGTDDRTGFEILIEETEAAQHVDEIAAASDRTESLVFGSGDYSASIGVEHSDTREEYTSEDNIDEWYYIRKRILVAARSNGLDPIDGAYTDFDDTDGFREICQAVDRMGYTGKWAIHPSQIEIANRVFAPSESDIEHAREVLAALQRAKEEGRGAVDLGDGVMVDVAHKRHAERTIALAKEIGMIE